MITVIQLSKPAAGLLEMVKKDGPILVPRNNKMTQEILGLVVYREWRKNSQLIEIGTEEQFLRRDEKEAEAAKRTEISLELGDFLL